MQRSRIVQFFVFIFFYSSFICFSQDSLYTLATWKGFSESAVSYTWDDNTSKQLSDAIPLFDKYNFKATFFVTTNTNPNWNGFKSVQANGHEVASHTLSHPWLNQASDSIQEKEQKESQDIINNQMMDKKCLTLAYPFCTSGNKSITSKYYISARGCSGQIENKTPADFFNVSSIVCGKDGVIKTTADFNSKTAAATSINGWTVFLLHGINNDGGYSSIDSTELSKHLQYVNDNSKKFWVNTYGNVVKYIRERDASVVFESTKTDSLIIFTLTHTLDTNIYNLPITVKRLVPAGWMDYSVTQNGKTIPTTAWDENGKKYFMMDVFPNAGKIVLKKKPTNKVEEQFLVSSFEVFPNPANESATIRFTVNQATTLSVELWDASGKIIRRVTKGNYTAGTQEVALNTSTLPNTSLYVVIRSGENQAAKKILLNR